MTFGFHGNYLVVGVGPSAVEGILARWNRPAPAWLTKAMEQTAVPRRTGIIYLNLKTLRDRLLALASSQKDALATLELLGLDNVDSLISTTGLEDDGMINRVLLTVNGKPRGLLDMATSRPLAAKDLEPIPSDALLALAARVDLDRVLKVLTAACEGAGAAGETTQKTAENESGPGVRRILSSLGDTWSVYNAPTEGEMALLGWTAVVPVRDHAALVDAWEKLFAAQEKEKAEKEDAKDKPPAHVCGYGFLVGVSAEFRKCRFAGHEIYYVRKWVIAPAFCVTDHEMVMTLNMPAMKAYLLRKEHRSLATLPGVARALNAPNPPAALGYCDTPRVFEFLYPLFCVYGMGGASAAQEAKIDLDPTFWPSSPAIRPHLQPDITTLERTPLGLQLTCRYCLPTGGANGPAALILMEAMGSSLDWRRPLLGPFVIQCYSGDPSRRPQEMIYDASPAPPPASSEGSSSDGTAPPAVDDVPPIPYGDRTVPSDVPLWPPGGEPPYYPLPPGTPAPQSPPASPPAAGNKSPTATPAGGDPDRRAQEEIYDSENLRLLQDDWERLWMVDRADHRTPYRTFGGLDPALPAEDGCPAAIPSGTATPAECHQPVATEGPPSPISAARGQEERRRRGMEPESL